MTIDFTQPTVTTTKATFPTYIVDMFEALVKMNLSGALNIPDEAIRWSSTNKRFEIYDSVTSSWGALTSYYDVTATSLNGLTASISEINQVCADISATSAEIDAACDGIGVSIPKFVRIDINDWNMSTTVEKTVSHTLSSKIYAVIGLTIRDDAGVKYCGSVGRVAVNAGDIDDSPVDVAAMYFDSDSIYLMRRENGFFDGTDFDSTSYNRGWIIVAYYDS